MKMGLGQATPQIFRFHPNLTPYGAVRSSDNEHNRQLRSPCITLPQYKLCG